MYEAPEKWITVPVSMGTLYSLTRGGVRETGQVESPPAIEAPRVVPEAGVCYSNIRDPFSRVHPLHCQTMGLALRDERVDVQPEASPGASTMALARAAAGGDSAATGQLLRLLAPRLSRVVRAVLGGHHPDVDDAFQQSLIGLVQALPAFRGDCEPIGYATIIAVRRATRSRPTGAKR